MTNRHRKLKLMRFGMCGAFLPEDMNDLTPEMCQRVARDRLFRHFHPLQRKRSPHHAARQRGSPASTAGRREPAPLSGDGLLAKSGHARRKRARRSRCGRVQAALKLAGWMGARGIDTGPGSINPAGPWFPHPDNWTDAARKQLVKSLKECAQAAEDAGVFLSVEGHQLVTLESAEVDRRNSRRSRFALGAQRLRLRQLDHPRDGLPDTPQAVTPPFRRAQAAYRELPRQRHLDRKPAGAAFAGRLSRQRHDGFS